MLIVCMQDTFVQHVCTKMFQRHFGR